MTKKFMCASVLLAVCGCEPVDSVTDAIPAQTMGAAVVCGLTAVSPQAYGGWAGDCPGCDVDAADMAGLSSKCGLAVTKVLEKEATRTRFLAACARAAISLEAAAAAGQKPLLLIYFSGHGGQVADLDGDEADSKDETVCLYDGQLTDDLMWAALCKVHSGVRVAFVTDSCNSASNFKAPKDWVAAMRARSTRDKVNLACGFVHIGGCGDGESSYGGANGGEATRALLKALKPGLKWNQWVPAAQKLMPRGQKLSYAEVNGFGDMEAMR